MNSNDTINTTQILLDLCDGQPDAADRLTPHVYDELKTLAVAAMRRERNDHTLQPTALVNEAFLRLVNQERVEWQGKAHFCAVAAHTMRRILISHARKKTAEKRGGKNACRIPLHDDLCAARPEQDVDVLELDRLLCELEQLLPRHARVIELRFFTGLTIDETALALGVSDWTIKNDWRVARAWLLDRLDGESTRTDPT